MIKRQNKYNARKVTIDGIVFHSGKEGRRYSALKLLIRAGEIKDLKLQPRYDFRLNGVYIGFYKADFAYNKKVPWWRANGHKGVDWHPVLEDVKGKKTAMYNFKKKMMKAFHGIDILET